MARTLSIAGHVWRDIMQRRYRVRATVGRVSNEIVGTFDTIEAARECAAQYPDATIENRFSGHKESQ